MKNIVCLHDFRQVRDTDRYYYWNKSVLKVSIRAQKVSKIVHSGPKSVLGTQKVSKSDLNGLKSVYIVAKMCSKVSKVAQKV